MKKRKNIMCALRKSGDYPNGEVYRNSEDDIVITYTEGAGWPIKYICCSQADARLIARRINQFIDAGG